jgi:hypothetical protein
MVVAVVAAVPMSPPLLLLLPLVTLANGAMLCGLMGRRADGDDDQSLECLEWNANGPRRRELGLLANASSEALVSLKASVVRVIANSSISSSSCIPSSIHPVGGLIHNRRTTVAVVIVVADRILLCGILRMMHTHALLVAGIGNVAQRSKEVYFVDLVVAQRLDVCRKMRHARRGPPPNLLH